MKSKYGNPPHIKCGICLDDGLCRNNIFSPYYDDRLFILNIAPCTVTYDLNLITYIIHHLDAPDKYLWSVTTYKNTERYSAVRVDVFENIFEAERYAMEVEPDCPLASLNGDSWRQLQRSNQEGSEDPRRSHPGCIGGPRTTPDGRRPCSRRGCAPWMQQSR